MLRGPRGIAPHWEVPDHLDGLQSQFTSWLHDDGSRLSALWEETCKLIVSSRAQACFVDAGIEEPSAFVESSLCTSGNT